MTSTTFTVSGMTCGHCASAVESELRDVAGVTDVQVDLVAGGDSTVRLDADPMPDEATISTAVAEAGDYTVNF